MKSLHNFSPLGLAPYPRKQGTEMIVAAAITAIAGIGTAMSASANNAANISAAADLNEENRNWQHDEAELARERNRDEWNRQHEINKSDWYEQSQYNQGLMKDMLSEQFNNQRSQWQYQFYQTNAYNTPAAQAKRLNEAGLNPSAILGQGAAGLASAPSVSSPTPSSGSSVTKLPESIQNVLAGTAQTTAPRGEVNWLGDALNSLASAAKQLSSAGVDSNNIKYLTDSLSARLQKAFEEADTQKLINDHQRLDNFFSRESLEPRLKEQWKKVSLLSSQIAVNQSLKDDYDASADLKKMQEYLAEMMANKTISEDAMIQLQLSTYMEDFNTRMDLLREQKKTEKSKQDSNYADAFMKRAQGKSIETLTPVQENLFKVQARIAEEVRTGKHFENVITGGAIGEQIEALAARCRTAGIIEAAEYKHLQKAIKENNFYEINQFVDWLGAGFEMYRNAGIGASAFKGFPSKGSFDPNAGKGFIMDDDTGLIFKSPWSK